MASEEPEDIADTSVTNITKVNIDEFHERSVADDALENEPDVNFTNVSIDDDQETHVSTVRPKRKIQPVKNTKDVVKFVNSDDDTSDSEWEENESSNHGDTENEEGSESKGDDDDEESANSNDDDNEQNEEELLSDDCETDKEEALSAEGSCDIPPEMSKTDENCGGAEEEEEEEARERITVTKEDMPFLFEARGPGKRQIKIIQYKNDFIEQAEEMSSEASCDEEWKAKQDDIQDQVLQFEEEDVDISNIPVEGEDGAPDKEKEANQLESKGKENVLAEVALGIQVCGVCLLGSEEDNILECDKCGVTVHEGCYGVQSSDVHDESWFCDPCIFSAPEQVFCELCPERVGVMKATDSGKWAHVVCAFYTDGIGFGDTSTLKPIITTDIPPSKFGYNKCELCEDKRFAYTGYPINCDAGLCKSFFHVTCAQKHGYLMENLDDEDHNKASPFYAYCKIHVDKDQTRFYKKAYKLFREHLLAFSKNTASEKVLVELKKEHDKYIESRKLTFVPAIMTEKHPRALFGSVSAFSKLTRKAEIYGLDTNVPIIEDEPAERGIPKTVKPSVSVEFARFYENKRENMKQALSRKKQLNSNLHSNRVKEKELQEEIAFLQKELPKMSKKYEKLRFQAEAIWKFLNKIDPVNYSVPESLLEKPKIKIKTNIIQQKIGLKNCIMCNSYEQPDSMVDCDGCQYWFHFHCLDPPVTRNPKTSKAYAWFCSACSQGPDCAEDPLEALAKSKKSKTATKFGRAVKKPDHFKSDAKTETKPLPPTTQKKDEENESVVLFESNTFKTVCENCGESDITQKLHCNNCKNHFHLHCTAGSYENKIFLCDKCDESQRLEKAAEKASMKPQIELLDSCSGSKKRKNIFEVQYNLMQKRQKEGSQSEEENTEAVEVNEPSSDTNKVPQKDTDDELDDSYQKPKNETDDELNEIIREEGILGECHTPQILHQQITHCPSDMSTDTGDIKPQIIHQQVTESLPGDTSTLAADLCSSVITTTVVPKSEGHLTLEIATTSAAESTTVKIEPTNDDF